MVWTRPQRFLNVLQGNSFVKDKKFQDAERCYSKALDASSGRLGPMTVPKLENFVQLRAQLFTNRGTALCASLTEFSLPALTRLKQEKWLAAKTDCDEALDLDPSSWKALYRRGLARVELDGTAQVSPTCFLA